LSFCTPVDRSRYLATAMHLVSRVRKVNLMRWQKAREVCFMAHSKGEIIN